LVFDRLKGIEEGANHNVTLKRVNSEMDFGYWFTRHCKSAHGINILSTDLKKLSKEIKNKKSR